MEKVSLQNRISKLLSQLTNGLIEKEEPMRLALLAAVAGESIFFLGLPGTAKSMVSRRLKSAFKADGDLKYFEYLMNQFSTPDEIFGPVSLKSLENDEYRRITEGFLPSADVAFLDEIWKASPAIQNTLLTIINEKKFHNGHSVENVPLKALVAASNELPAQNMGLEALWDRFLIRLIVSPVQDKNFFKVILAEPTSESIEVQNPITIDELTQWQKEIRAVVVPENVQVILMSIRKELEMYNSQVPKENESPITKFYVSDRRWKKIVHVLRTSAFLNGRSQVDVTDCAIVAHCIWDNDEQRQQVFEIIGKSMEASVISKKIVESIAKRIDNEIVNLDDLVKQNSNLFMPMSIEKSEKLEKNAILSSIDENVKKIDTFNAQCSDLFKKNIFVDNLYVKFVTKRLEETKVNLFEQKIRLDKLYEQVENKESASIVPVSRQTLNVDDFTECVELMGNNVIKTFYLTTTPVTQDLYEKVMGKNPSFNPQPMNPVEFISAVEAWEFCKKLNQLEGLSNKHGWRLPTKEEWEYAARNGHSQRIWHKDNSGGVSHGVFSQNASVTGLRQMFGNVWEMTTNEENEIVVMGGSFTTPIDKVNECHCIEKLFCRRDIGFRICRTK